MRAQRVDAAVGGRAVGARVALRRVRVEVVPAVGHLLAAGLAAPQRRALGGRHEHAVVRILRHARARTHARSCACAVTQPTHCNNTTIPIAARPTAYTTRHLRQPGA